MLNEIAASVAGAAPDWVEIYNAGIQEVLLGGLSLSDSLAKPRKYVFFPSARVPARGFLLIDLDGDAPPTDRNAGFALKGAGDDLTLFAESGQILDRVQFGPQIRGLTIGRVPDGEGAWCLGQPTPEAPNEETALGGAQNLRINEWMALPETGDDWFELHNGSALPVCLTGLGLVDDLDKPRTVIAELSFIGSGAEAFLVFLASGSLSAPTDANFKLSGDGESIYLFDASQTLIDSVSWGGQTRGQSEGRMPDGSATIARFPLPTPSESNFQLLTNVWINEILSHTDNPFEDAIELYNPNHSPVDVSGFFLSDSRVNPKQFRLPTPTVIAPGGYAVFYESEFASAGDTNAFHLASTGDSLYLTAANAGGELTGFQSSVKFPASANGISFGRLVCGSNADYTPVRWPTFGVDNPNSREAFCQGAGGPNASPILGPIIINEIMFHPPDVIQGGLTNDNILDEYVELYNASPYPVPLYDAEFPEHTWQMTGGIDLGFPTNMTMEPRGYVLLVRFNPTIPQELRAFRSKYELTTNTVIVGPYGRRLSNRSDILELTRPDTPQSPGSPDAGFVPRLQVERIVYEDRSPWPDSADGTGASIQRVSSSVYGNVPNNWFAGQPTPGAPNLPDPQDHDADGMADAWEQGWGLSPADPSDASGDADGDGMTNLQEFLAGLNPRDNHSRLRLDITRSGITNWLEFYALANRTYTVQYRGALRPSVNDSTWCHVQNVESSPFDRLVRIDDLNKTNSVDQYYRVITPAD
ncbi:MAG: lamin tail domain-containing protein [Verrucomicrobia bacterium]|nr:lamin tail domain-containing protein [Verrucomicrobiota bacterium]